MYAGSVKIVSDKNVSTLKSTAIVADRGNAIPFNVSLMKRPWMINNVHIHVCFLPALCTEDEIKKGKTVNETIFVHTILLLSRPFRCNKVCMLPEIETKGKNEIGLYKEL